ncbi:hypothetical protein BGZ47_003507 [Haplosporangium gracile]|nr:hypothetical protein BGZ47_003507 [Haplosporangium gracile]
MDRNRTETPTPGELVIENLPAEAFQHICGFCSLHELAALRALSKRVRDLVDDSLTARNIFANPTEEVRSKQKQDPLACFISITLQRKHQPITAVFARYNKEHNYLEFTQRDTATVDIDIDTSTLGRLDFNNWEMQLNSLSKKANESTSTAPQQRPRRASITQAGSIRASQTYMEQELANGGPIQPLSTRQPILSSFFGSTSTPTATPAPAATVRQGFNHMAQYVRSTFASAPSGLTTEQIQQEARRMFHAVDNEVLSSKKQYEFVLTEGSHFIGDDDFIIRYTITKKEPVEDDTAASSETVSAQQLEFKIDFIRASWRWISSGAPKSLRSNKGKARTGGDQGRERPDDHEPWQTQLNPLPELRLGKMYAHRFNMLLEEIGRQKVSPGVRGQLRDLGYDASLFPKKFIYANLRDEHVLRWITQEHFDKADREAAALKKAQEQERKTLYDDWEMVESTSTSQQLAQIRADRIKADREKDDRAELQEMVKLLEEEKGYLTARNILEEMLACQGYSKDLIWKYGVVRRNMMEPVPSQIEAKKLLTKVIDSEAAHASTRPHPAQI